MILTCISLAFVQLSSEVTYVELKTVRKNMLKDALTQAYNRISETKSLSENKTK